jgi:hypothetical protein
MQARFPLRAQDQQKPQRHACYPPYLGPRRSAAFRQLLAAGSREAAHPLLRWLLAQAPLLGRRAFVGHHLSLPEVGAGGGAVMGRQLLAPGMAAFQICCPSHGRLGLLSTASY